ncbi:N-formylglutamate amidohydrolase [Pseudobdellovibrio exovorus]|uniref:Putative formiminoglutamase n=1 Tax=Pseudobdellovibrio exovorus JSS TaxID=1184267 RepID=M4VCG9_9BACT|nr:N-formylglutamate amidohydrolase [Pseudobdellovibrio exovorus]AGH95731.1 putative formiminoglutamase [Pseudobdellovibrio exovorus JSS]
MSQTIPFFISIPHSGERVPEQTPWLKTLPEEILMADVDRYVDLLYKPTLESLQIPSQMTDWHRYAVDLNRIPTDVDASSVVGAPKPAGTHADGYHWVMTKNEVQLMPAPMSEKIHEELTELIYEPFHAGVRNHYDFFKKNGHPNVFHIDAHSMPSLGTRMHRDPGETRADIVISDCLGKSCHPKFRDLVIAAYATAGFKVGYNWPYMGGRVTEQYGHPQVGQHAIQVELNRALYMDERTKQLLPQHQEVRNKLLQAIAYVKSELHKINLTE